MKDPTLYEPWTPASSCEIKSIIGPIIGGAISLFGGSQAAGAAEDAAGAQVEAARLAADVSREALGFTREMFNVGRADLSPYRATGAGALQTMNNMFLPGGHPMVQMQGQLNELRADRARLMSGGTAAVGTQQGQQGTSSQQLAALEQAFFAREGDGFASRGGEAAPGDGAGTWDGTFADWTSQMLEGNFLSATPSAGGDGGGFAGDPSVSGMTADPSGQTGASASGMEADPGGGGGSADSDSGGGDMGKGQDPGGGAEGSPFHKGGLITDHNPKTYRNNLRFTGQEGEVVMSRKAVKMLGKNFLIRANKTANRRAA